MPPQYIFQIEQLSKIANKKEILKNVWISFYPGAKIGVLGVNGSGKSTLLRIMAGVDKDFTGMAKPANGTRIGFVPQEPTLDETLDVRGNVEKAVAPIRKLLKRFDEINTRLCEPISNDEMDKLLDEQAKVQDGIDTANAWELDRTVEIAMDAMRLPPGDADVTKLSGGERRRVALCKTLLECPDILLLDEPTNHLDAESVAWLERYLSDFPGTVVAVTHDRYFLDNAAQWILELDRGQGIPWEGNYTSWLEQKQARLEKEDRASDARRKTLERELEWVRLSPRARQAKNQARMKRYEQLASQESDKRDEALTLYIPPGPHLGDLVVEAKGVSKAFGDRLLFENMDFRLPPGGIVGVVGPNGAGKTTLFKMIVGQEQPDSGGERNRVHLAKLLKSGGNLLLLDEPTNDLDVETLRALEDAVVEFGGCAVVISHDRWFLDRIATHILAFEGESQVFWCEGNYQVYEEQRKARLGLAADQPHRIQYKSLTR